jgi:hypothetical protein
MYYWHIALVIPIESLWGFQGMIFYGYMGYVLHTEGAKWTQPPHHDLHQSFHAYRMAFAVILIWEKGIGRFQFQVTELFKWFTWCFQVFLPNGTHNLKHNGWWMHGTNIVHWVKFVANELTMIQNTNGVIYNNIGVSHRWKVVYLIHLLIIALPDLSSRISKWIWKM